MLTNHTTLIEEIEIDNKMMNEKKIITENQILNFEN